MADSQFDVERATAGLVTTLFVAAALLLALMVYFVLRDVDQRSEQEETSAAAVRVVPVSPSTASTSSISVSSR